MATLGVAAILSVVGACGSAAETAAPVTTTVVSTAPTTVKVTTTVMKTSTVVPEPVVTTVTVPQTVLATITEGPPVPAAAFEDGTYVVGKDVEPGTYQSNSTDDCYWVRKDQLGEIIDNDFGTVATIQASDFIFQTNRCGSWTKIG